MSVPIMRVIDKLDNLLASNDIKGAEDHLCYWEKEASKERDSSSLLSICNEQIGFYRRNRDDDKALKAIGTALEILAEKELTPSCAAIFVNIATTYKGMGRYDEAMSNYLKAEDVFERYDMKKSYEYAAFLNNRGTLYSDLNDRENAVKDLDDAVRILKDLGTNKAEIAVSYINKAHAIEKDDPDQVEMLLDMAWEELNAVPYPRGGEYAFVLSKCAPSFEYFGRKFEADALREVSDEIYQGN